MDSSDRTHRTGSTRSSTSSELFICFTSRLSSSSSSMKISSKSSILSPGRARDPSISLSTSLSRRLRTSGSIKNGHASPMFPTGGRKRGCGFENPEPSSPKVTCIGQVRVKTKKQSKKLRTLSRRQSGEVSFRKIEHSHDQIQRQTSINNQYQQECLPHRNQRWVHLPLSICEALRGLRAEFSCLFPCRSSCFSSSEREKEEKEGREGNTDEQSSCRAVFTRWLVAVQDGEGEKGREIELVGGDEEKERSLPVRSSRRHMFDEIEIKDEIFGVKEHQANNMEGEEGRVSICIPPKNALLLMRCRSDPVKMEALTNRFWETTLPKDDEENDDVRENDEDNGDAGRDKEESINAVKIEVNDEVEMVQKEDLEVSEKRVSVSVDMNEEQENHPEAEMNLEIEVQDNEENPKDDLQINDELQDGEQEKQEETVGNQTVVEEENEVSFVTALEALVDQESEEIDKNDPMEEKNEEDSRVSYTFTSFPLHLDEPEEEELAEESAMESTAEKETEDKTLEVKVVEKVTQQEEIQETHKEEEEEGEEGTRKTEERETESNGSAVVVERESSVLPDCLLLMMCEPKLSMEVSKETWVCSTDFIRWQPEKKKPVQVIQTDGGDESKKRVSIDYNSNTNSYSAIPLHPAHHQPLQQPPRSSCSLPATAAAGSMATMIEQKLVNAVAYEPLALTRCKSEPMRTASKLKLAPDACFWKNRKLEPHRRSTFGVGAARVGC